MNKRFDCEIIRDLLPSYVDGLASDTTKKAVEEHLTDCADCSAALKCMKEPEPLKAVPAEVDYLKKVRRHTNRKSLLIGIILMLVGMSTLLYRFFYIGSEASATEVICHVFVENNTVSVSGTLAGSGQAVSRVTFSNSNGMVQFRVYTVPKTFFNNGDFNETYTVASPIGQVRVDDLIVWDNGMEIGSTASQLFAAVNPYVGDMPANTRVASILGISDQFGPYSNELQTATEPYGWTLILELSISQDEESVAKEIMSADSYAMLAVIGNLGSVTWQYYTEAGLQEYTVTEEMATVYAGQDIKQFADSISSLQTLLQSLSFKWSGVRETLQEEGTFYMNIRNNCDDKIYGICIDYYLDGELIGSRGFENANSSPLSAGKVVSYDFAPEDFPDDTSAIQLNRFSFNLSVTDRDGNETVVCEGANMSAKYAWTFFFTLTGDYKNGFVLNEG
ncbi:MAG TPA: DUF4825 domain-containing protein [Lachnospiraceae bacterium]|nr:DUF4825 domain-containing protein [Lachnospiraceae bacterium]